MINDASESMVWTKHKFPSPWPYRLALPTLVALVMTPAAAIADRIVLDLRETVTVADVIKSVAWNPSGTQIATAGDAPHAVVWDAKSLKAIRQLEEDYKGYPGHHSVAFSADGRLLASGVKVVDVWDTATWQRKLELVGPAMQLGVSLQALPPGARGVQSLTFSRDQQRIVIAYATPPLEGNQVIAFRVADGSIAWKYDQRPTLGGYPSVTAGLVTVGKDEAVAFGTRESTFGARVDRKIFTQVVVLDASAGTVLRTLDQVHVDAASDLAVSKDGKWFATGTNTGSTTTSVNIATNQMTVLENKDPIRVWDSHSGSLVKEFPISSHVWALAFSADGQYLVSAQSDAPTKQTLRVWNLESGELVQTLVTSPSLGSCFGLAFSPDGHQLAAACGSVLAVFRYRV